MKIITSILKKLRKLAISTAKLAVILILIGLIVSGFLSTLVKQDLHPWHSKKLEGEFRAEMAGSGFDFQDYLELEEKLFNRLKSYFLVEKKDESISVISRYADQGPNNPSFFKTNWNKTQILKPEVIKGGALMIHGLSDSPYSLKATAQEFLDKGFYVVALRVPGHGTIPRGLIDAHWTDWTAAVSIAATHVKETVADKPFVIAGYSNGGALALHYTTEALLSDKQVPDGLLLFSPAVSVSPFAVASNWHKIITWIPYFEKDKWLSVLPEIDPYKYNSFTKNAGAQIFQLTRRVRQNLLTLVENQNISKMPEMLTFQSAVDATIPGEAVVNNLYLKLTEPKSELVIYDILNSTHYSALFAINPRSELEDIEESEIVFDFTLVGNVTDRREVVAATRVAGTSNFEIEPTELLWPQSVFSLSHVAIPFSPDDPIYGESPRVNEDSPISLGSLAPRGESGVLLLSSDLLMRLRFNPFFSYQQKRIADWADNLLRE